MHTPSMDILTDDERGPTHKAAHITPSTGAFASPQEHAGFQFQNSLSSYPGQSTASAPAEAQALGKLDDHQLNLFSPGLCAFSSPEYNRPWFTNEPHREHDINSLFLPISSAPTSARLADHRYENHVGNDSREQIVQNATHPLVWTHEEDGTVSHSYFGDRKPLSFNSSQVSDVAYYNASSSKYLDHHDSMSPISPSESIASSFESANVSSYIAEGGYVNGNHVPVGIVPYYEPTYDSPMVDESAFQRNRSYTLESAITPVLPQISSHPYPVVPTSASPTDSPVKRRRRGRPRKDTLAESDTYRSTPSPPTSLDESNSRSDERPGQAIFRLHSPAVSLPRDTGPFRKKPIMACLFCRERKIACGSPAPGDADQRCNQCARRSLVCEYPKESRRGQHKRTSRAERVEAHAAASSSSKSKKLTAPGTLSQKSVFINSNTSAPDDTALDVPMPHGGSHHHSMGHAPSNFNLPDKSHPAQEL